MAISFGYEVKIGNMEVSSVYSINGINGKPRFQTVLPHDFECKIATASVCRRIAYDLLCKAALLNGNGFSPLTKEDVDAQVERMKDENSAF